jgi:hypothetical protein
MQLQMEIFCGTVNLRIRFGQVSMGVLCSTVII